jgi:hypothetical protein
MATYWLLTALLAAAVTAPVASPLPLTELPTQTLAKDECALVLWERATGRRVAMLMARPEVIRVVIGGVETFLPRTSSDGEPVVGFAPRAQFAGNDIRIATALTIVGNDVAGSAIVRDGIISVTGSDGVEVIAPVAGIAGCNR